ncbi:MAG: hypothetical protein R2856_01985 [Caldilineaceae bacterium]
MATVPGFGPKRVRGMRESLAGRLHRRPPQTPRAATPPPPDQPPVVQLLDIDDEYRRNARRLPRIAAALRPHPRGLAARATHSAR